MNPESIHTIARAVIILEGHVLLARAKGEVYTFLPGGHVEPGETIVAALIREISEEVGQEICVGPYIAAVEHRWADGEYHQHEINPIFAATLIAVNSLRPIASREPHLEFLWAAAVDLPAYDLRPPPVVALIQNHLRGAVPPVEVTSK